MKATDLMIGDWVNGWDGRWHPVCVSTISSYPEHRPTIVACGGYGYSLVDQVKPIPITPEIMEKNVTHYIEREYMNFFPIGNKDAATIIVYKRKSKQFVLLDKSLSEVCKIKYVHELQHALRLCGIDKEIVL